MLGEGRSVCRGEQDRVREAGRPRTLPPVSRGQAEGALRGSQQTMLSKNSAPMFSRPWATGVRETDSLCLRVSSAMCQAFQLKDKEVRKG